MTPFLSLLLLAGAAPRQDATATLQLTARCEPSAIDVALTLPFDGVPRPPTPASWKASRSSRWR